MVEVCSRQTVTISFSLAKPVVMMPIQNTLKYRNVLLMQCMGEKYPS